jgi:hypothetical protein
MPPDEAQGLLHGHVPQVRIEALVTDFEKITLEDELEVAAP